MSVALDTTTAELDKTEFDAEFDADAPEQTADDEFVCVYTCSALMTV